MSDASFVLRSLCREAESVGRPTAASLWLADAVTATVRPIAADGMSALVLAPLPMDHHLGRVAAEGIPSLQPLEAAAGPGAAWRYVIPLEAAETRGCAVIEFASDEPPTPAALERVGTHLCDALAGALALHLAAAETASVDALLKAVPGLIAAEDIDLALDVLLRAAMPLIDAATGSVMLLDPNDGRLRIAAAKGLPPEVVEHTSLGEGEGVAGWVLATGRSAVVEDLVDRGSHGRRHGVCSAVCVPIADDAGVLGVLNVGARRFHRQSSARLTRVLEGLTTAAAHSLRGIERRADRRAAFDGALVALARAIEATDAYSCGSADRVVAVSRALGVAIGMTETELETLRVAALFHDAGMTAAGDAPGYVRRPLTVEEQGMVRLHPGIAADMLSRAEAFEGVAPVVAHHHEHYDGSGYMLGVAGDRIPVGARVLAVADAFVAMTSPRPYRGAMTPAVAAAEVARHAGSQFDPDVVTAFLALFEDGAFDAA